MLTRTFLLGTIISVLAHSNLYAFDSGKKSRTHLSLLGASISSPGKRIIHKTYEFSPSEADTDNNSESTADNKLNQIQELFFLGLETSITGGTYSDNPNSPFFYLSEEEWSATLQGKAGIQINNSLLLYATAGLIAAEKVYDDDDVSLGWIAGAGMEFTTQDGIRFGFDTLYVDFGEDSNAGNSAVKGKFAPSAKDPSGLIGRARIIVPIR